MVFLEWILKYWLQVLFGLICAGIALCWKRIKAWRAAYKKKEAEELKNSIVKDLAETMAECSHKSDENDRLIKLELEQMKAGLLSVQGAQFRQACRELLQEGHIITLQDYDLLAEQHKAYNGLGGNSVGDELFSMVTTKFESQVK